MKFKLLKTVVLGFLLSMSSFANAGLITLNSGTGAVNGNSLDFAGLFITLSGGGRDVGAPYADSNGVYNTINGQYPTSNDIVFSFDDLVENVTLSFDPYGLETSGRGALWVEVFNGLISLGSQKILDGAFHTESLSSFGPMTSFVVNNGCSTASGDTSCSWVSQYNAVSFDVAAVPEPSTLAVFALGLMGFASRRFKKQS
ncbi:MAG: hypothetical protein ACI9VT_002592 [Psychroserpens sp.]|jgi:hypothetical protein